MGWLGEPGTGGATDEPAGRANAADDALGACPGDETGHAKRRPSMTYSGMNSMSLGVGGCLASTIAKIPPFASATALRLRSGGGVRETGGRNPIGVLSDHGAEKRAARGRIMIRGHADGIARSRTTGGAGEVNRDR